MISAQKPVHVSFPAGIAVLSLLLSVVSANDLTRRENVHSSNKHKIPEITPQLSFQIKLHGFLLWASVGFLMPAAILVKRMSNRRESRRKQRIILYIHAITQVVAALLATAAAVLSIIYFENSFSNDHQRIGLAIYGAIWLQALVGMIRPHRGSKGRSFWFLFHWLVGTAVSLLGVINIYTGLQAYHRRTSRNATVWTVVFTVEISSLFFIYLLQEKWHYIQRQGVILGNEPVQPTDQEMSPRCQRKEEII
ncbi:cytochrome b561 domain-containing protein At4g18260-like isoform X2 [Henckelia pumila]|uniref:cytochrome b561 domain-containing protein At4g18260-like isoform X2 n=1 Tax=Henckelia pumila TaxID=405737 RepID=UPI003C6E398C